MIEMKRILRKAVEIASPLLYRKFFSSGGKSRLWNGKQSAVSLTFDVEYARDAEALRKTAELLDSYELRGSFACIGKLVESFPKQHGLLADDGHEIVNHTYSHPNHDVLNPSKFFNKLSPREQEFEISEFERVSKRILDVEPEGFRAPHFGDLNSQGVYDLLEKKGYLYSSSTVLTKTRSNGMPFRPSKQNFLRPGAGSTALQVLELPIMTCPKHYYSVFDSYHCFRTSPPAHSKEGDFAALFEKAVEMGLKHNIPSIFYFDPSDIAEKKDFETALEYLNSKKNLWLATCAEIAKFKLQSE